MIEYVIVHPKHGIFLDDVVGIPLFSGTEPEGFPAARTFPSTLACAKHMHDVWRNGYGDPALSMHGLEVYTSGYATIKECVDAGLPAWDPRLRERKKVDEEHIMTVENFARLGYLREVNRCFLHPLGLALEVSVPPGQPAVIQRIWDYRDDPEGLRYDRLTHGEREQAEQIEQQRQEKAQKRLELLGFINQPYPNPEDEEEETPHGQPTRDQR